MKKLCPNLDREDGLETVLEVPIPENNDRNKSGSSRAWHNMKSWMKPNAESSSSSASMGEIKLMLGVVGAPLIPFPISKSTHNQALFRGINKEKNIEASMAKYIVKQYVAAVGGLRAIESMYAVGQVKMGGWELWGGEISKKKMMKLKKRMEMNKGEGEMGGFVMWSKTPDLWCLEMVLSGHKISAGSDSKLAWRQTPWHHSHASRGPPRLLRRFLQGLDPNSTANLFSNSICIGEKTVNNQDCFVLKLEAKMCELGERSSSNVEIIRHTMWGYFSQRTGLLVQLEDSHLVRIKSQNHNNVYWETTMESWIEDYRDVDGMLIAHAGKTLVSLIRFGEGPQSHSRTRMEEVWEIEEVDFNIKGLSMDCFLAPSDLKKEQNRGETENGGMIDRNSKLPDKIRSASFRIHASKIAAVSVDDDHLDDLCSSESDGEL